jgi:hypothetical protein
MGMSPREIEEIRTCERITLLEQQVDCWHFVATHSVHGLLTEASGPVQLPQKAISKVVDRDKDDVEELLLHWRGKR